MNILHINTTDSGGAAKAMIRLHEGLLQKNISSKVLTLYHQSASYQKKVFPFHNGHHSFIDKARYSLLYRMDHFKKKQALKNKLTNYEVFSFPFSIYDLHKHPLVKEADLIHLHWVGGFLDYETFFKQIDKPIVWTLHDLNPFSGGFHYANDSANHQDEFADLEEEYLKIKKNALKACKNLNIVCLSQWIKATSEKSDIFKSFPHHLIANGLDLEVFKPRPKTALRQKYNLPLDKNILLFVADNIHNKRKGFQHLQEALKHLDRKDFVCVLVGNDEKPLEEEYFLPLHFISEETELAEVYAAADICIVPSLEDNLPNTVLEAMASGLPVVGFEVGGIPDMIQPSKNGSLVPLADSISLAQKIEEILDNPTLQQNFGEQAREIASQNYSIQRQATQYLSLYEDILNAKNSNSLSPKGEIIY